MTRHFARLGRDILGRAARDGEHAEQRTVAGMLTARVDMGQASIVALVSTFVSTLVACAGPARSRPDPSVCSPILVVDDDLDRREVRGPSDPVCQTPEGRRFLQVRQDLARLAAAYLRCKSSCPTLADLREVAREVPADDPWHSRYLVVCTDSDFHVRSLGPDREIGTRDDVRMAAAVRFLPPSSGDDTSSPYPPCPTFPPCPR
jgi:hypothetical protein